jgi:hypothetical protein
MRIIFQIEVLLAPQSADGVRFFELWNFAASLRNLTSKWVKEVAGYNVQTAHAEVSVVEKDFPSA